jgi:hypothetical protein
MLDFIHHFYHKVANRIPKIETVENSKNCMPNEIFQEYYQFCKNQGFPNRLIHRDEIRENIRSAEGCSNIIIAMKLRHFNRNQILSQNEYFNMNPFF